MPDDDPGPQRRHRHTRHGQQSLRPTSTAQVRRQVVFVGAQSPEIDDAAHTLLRRSLTKGSCRGCIFRLEVGAGQRMHQVVGRAAVPQCGSKRGRIGSVGPHRLSRAAVLPGPPGHRSDLETGVDQRRAQPPAHEPRSSGDQYGGAHPPSLPSQETRVGRRAASSRPFRSFLEAASGQVARMRTMDRSSLRGLLPVIANSASEMSLRARCWCSTAVARSRLRPSSSVSPLASMTPSV